MGVNHYKKHLVVFLEDAPYRDILNGVKLSLNVNDGVIDVKNPCGGWGKVFDKLKENLYLLKNNNCHILLLIDFDDKEPAISNSHESRKKIFEESVPTEYKERVYFLGVNYKQSEDLKKFFNLSNFETIGRHLVNGCPNGGLSGWQNIHLASNLSEIQRMQHNGVFDWLFKL